MLHLFSTTYRRHNSGERTNPKSGAGAYTSALLFGGETGYEFIGRHWILFHDHGIYLVVTLVKWIGIIE